MIIVVILVIIIMTAGIVVMDPLTRDFRLYPHALIVKVLICSITHTSSQSFCQRKSNSRMFSSKMRANLLRFEPCKDQS